MKLVLLEMKEFDVNIGSNEKILIYNPMLYLNFNTFIVLILEVIVKSKNGKENNSLGIVWAEVSENTTP